jgi:hypothetical protein
MLFDIQPIRLWYALTLAVALEVYMIKGKIKINSRIDTDAKTLIVLYAFPIAIFPLF